MEILFLGDNTNGPQDYNRGLVICNSTDSRIGMTRRVYRPSTLSQSPYLTSRMWQIDNRIGLADSGACFLQGVEL